MVLKDGELLLSKRHEDPEKASSLLNGAGTWTMPGAKLDFGLFPDSFSGKPKVMEPDEITEWDWFDINNLPSPIYFPSAKVLENYKQKKFYISR